MNPFRSESARHRENLENEALYAAVADEVTRGEVRRGLYAQAVVESEGDEVRGRARYIELRVAALRTERGAALEQQGRPASLPKPGSPERLLLEKRNAAAVSFVAGAVFAVWAAALQSGGFAYLFAAACVVFGIHNLRQYRKRRPSR